MTRLALTLDYNPTDDERELLVRSAIQYTNKLIYKKIGKNQYRVHCNVCGADHIVPYKTIVQIRNANICKWCGENIRTSTKENEHIHRWLMFKNHLDGKEHGFSVDLDAEWGIPTNVSLQHVAEWIGKNTYVKGIIRCMTTLVFQINKSNWRKVRNPYNYYHYSFDYIREYDTDSLKNRYERFESIHGIQFKSNQKKILIDGVYNENQMLYMHFFDLNTEEQINKYSGYIKRHQIKKNLPRILNVFYLDYLSRYENDIYLVDYVDYVNQCEKLHIKPEKLKPEDFRKRHYQLSQRIQEIADEACNNSIIQLSTELASLNYDEGNISIKVFDDAKQIRTTGQMLHNCIGSYVKRYANRETNIYYGTVDGKLEFALEEKDKKIIQVRTDFNKGPTDAIRQVVSNWSAINGFAYGG